MRALPFAALILSLPSVMYAQATQSSPVQSLQQDHPKGTASSETSTATKNNRTRVVTNLAGFDLVDAKKLSGQAMVVGATRGANPIVPLVPHLGKLYGANPTFAWGYEDKAAKFVFVLTDDAQAEVYRAEVSGTRFRYPAGAPAFQAGKIYFWSVSTPTSLVGSNSSYPSGLLVVSTVQRQEIEKKLAEFSGDSYEAGVARAQVFTDARLWYDALDAFTDLIERYPSRAELYERRGTIYAQLHCTQELAEADFSRAAKAQEEEK